MVHNLVRLLHCPAGLPLCVITKKGNISTACPRVALQRHTYEFHELQRYDMKGTHHGEVVSACFSRKLLNGFGEKIVGGGGGGSILMILGQFNVCICQSNITPIVGLHEVSQFLESSLYNRLVQY
jgi:hypothetical protein